MPSKYDFDITEFAEDWLIQEHIANTSVKRLSPCIVLVSREIYGGGNAVFSRIGFEAINSIMTSDLLDELNFKCPTVLLPKMLGGIYK